MEVRRSALVAHSAVDMFDLIEGAEHYPAFLPWCAGATILSRDDALVRADIDVAWHGVSFRMTTRNPKRRPEWLAFQLERGPFRRFEGEWHLRALAPDACKVEFALRYELGGALMPLVAAAASDRLVGAFVDAFVRRADALYACPGGDDARRSPATSASRAGGAMKLSRFVKFREEKFGGVLFETRSEKVYTLNATGAAIVREALAGADAPEIARRLAGQFDHPVEAIAHEAGALLAELRAKGLVEDAPRG